MIQKSNLSTVCRQSDDVVARKIEGDIIIVPLTAGVTDDDEAIFTLNPTARSIWQQLDGQRSLREVVDNLTEEFKADKGVIEADVLGLVKELLKRKILVNV